MSSILIGGASSSSASSSASLYYGSKELNSSDSSFNFDAFSLFRARERYYDSDWKGTILDKLNQQKKIDSNLEKNIREKYGVSLEDFAIILGDEEQFKEKLLLPNYKPDRIIKELNDDMQRFESLKDLGDEYIHQQFRNFIEGINKRKEKLSETKMELILTECMSSKVNNYLFRTIVNNI